MGDTAQIEFALELFTPQPAPPRAGAGRRKGTRNKRTSVGWRIAEIATPDIMRQIVARALRCEDDGDIRCAEIVLNRTMPRPKTPPIAIDLTQNIDARALLTLVANGEMSPTDAASLWNSLSRNGHGASAVAELAPGRADVREQVAGKLAGIVAARQVVAAQQAEILADDAIAELLAAVEPVD